MSFEQNKVVKLQVPVQRFLADPPLASCRGFFEGPEEESPVRVADSLGYFLQLNNLKRPGDDACSMRWRCSNCLKVSPVSS